MVLGELRLSHCKGTALLLAGLEDRANIVEAMIQSNILYHLSLILNDIYNAWWSVKASIFVLAVARSVC